MTRAWLQSNTGRIFALSNSNWLQGLPLTPYAKDDELGSVSGVGLMRNKIISSLAGAAFSFAASGFAFAADLNKPVYKAPPPPPPAPVYSWTGWYVGGNVGYGWGNSNVDIGANGVVPNLFGGGPPFTPSNLAFSGSHSQELEGVIGGGQIGYNYQFSPNGVLGFEADIQASGQRATNNFVDSSLESLCFDSTGAPEFRCLESLPPGPVVGSTAYEAKIDWFGTVRARLGVLATDAFLVYATGGLAYGRVGVSGSTNFNATFSGLGTICPRVLSQAQPRSTNRMLTSGTRSAAASREGFHIGSRQIGRGNWSTSI